MNNIVHIDTDNAEWGRVVGDAEILNIDVGKNKDVLVNAHSIRANILVKKKRYTINSSLPMRCVRIVCLRID